MKPLVVMLYGAARRAAEVVTEEPRGEGMAARFARQEQRGQPGKVAQSTQRRAHPNSESAHCQHVSRTGGLNCRPV